MKKLLFTFMITIINIGIYCSEFSYSVYSDISKRKFQEDRYMCEAFNFQKKPGLIAAVFDGHGGHEVAHELKGYFFRVFSEQLALTNDIRQALVNTFQDCNQMLARLSDCLNSYMHIGSTAAVVVAYGKKSFLANIGDSRIYLRCSENYYVTRDHTIADEKELEYYQEIMKKMPFVAEWGIQFLQNSIRDGRVGGGLVVTRSLGDLYYKNIKGQEDTFKRILPEKRKTLYAGLEEVAEYYPAVRENPDITEYDIKDSKDYVILASDGFWDKIKNEEVHSLVTKFQGEPNIAQALVREATQVRKSKDNTTVIFIPLPYK